MKKIPKITIILIVLLIPVISLACKDPMFGKSYPVTEFNEYDSIVIVKIDESIHSDEYRYKPLISFEATVLENIKGDLKEGNSFLGKPKHAQARAVCPVLLIKNGTYLLLLSKEKGEYFISRFSFPVKNNNEYFPDYINQIKGAINSEKSI